MDRENKICELESEIICEPLRDYIEAMREDLDATNDEIYKSVTKELKYLLSLPESVL